jgi:hypothetical protein
MLVDMATYSVTAYGDPVTFSVGIVGDDGARQTMLGFVSQAAAESWIAQDQRKDANSPPTREQA